MAAASLTVRVTSLDHPLAQALIKEDDMEARLRCPKVPPPRHEQVWLCYDHPLAPSGTHQEAVLGLGRPP